MPWERTLAEKGGGSLPSNVAEAYLIGVTQGKRGGENPIEKRLAMWEFTALKRQQVVRWKTLKGNGNG